MTNLSSRPQKKRKLIDLPVSTLQDLGLLAVRNNMSLKAYIEHLLICAAERARDRNLLLRLSRNPAGYRLFTEEETERIIRYLRQQPPGDPQTETHGQP